MKKVDRNVCKTVLENVKKELAYYVTRHEHRFEFRYNGIRIVEITVGCW
jgi:hypothetical protein